MAPGDTVAIREFTDEVKGLRADLRVFRTKLFGDDESERPAGRIPTLESSSADHEVRIKKIERIIWGATGIIAFVGAIEGLVPAIYYFLTYTKH